MGGGAGSSRRPAASLTMASTTAPSTALVVARAAAGARATTAPGMPAASASSSFSSTSAGAQPTDTSTPRPSAERLVRRVGTTAPAATSRTPRRATRLIHVTLGLTSSTALLPLTATSQPSDSRTGMASASARAPDGNRTSGCRLQPTAGPPTASSRSARSSLVVEVVPRPPAQTTTCPADHEACSWTRPMTSASSSAEAVPSVVESSSSRARSRARSSSKSATTRSRSGPDSPRTEARLASASTSSRSSVRRHATGSASRRARSSAVARPSATAHVACSSCRVASCMKERRSLRRVIVTGVTSGVRTTLSGQVGGRCPTPPLELRSARAGTPRTLRIPGRGHPHSTLGTCRARPSGRRSEGHGAAPRSTPG